MKKTAEEIQKLLTDGGVEFARAKEIAARLVAAPTPEETRLATLADARARLKALPTLGMAATEAAKVANAYEREVLLKTILANKEPIDE